MNYLSLFSGIGGFDLGFDRAGMQCVCQVEFDKHAASVLEKHWKPVTRLSLVDSRVRTCPLPDAGRDWLESEADFGLNSIAFLQKLAPNGWLSRMSPVCYPAMKDEILPSSFEGWSNSGMASLGGCLTLNISDWPSDANVCSLSEVLETDVPHKYYLSQKAARGILRRAEKRGKEIQGLLLTALERVAKQT